MKEQVICSINYLVNKSVIYFYFYGIIFLNEYILVQDGVNKDEIFGLGSVSLKGKHYYSFSYDIRIDLNIA